MKERERERDREIERERERENGQRDGCERDFECQMCHSLGVNLPTEVSYFFKMRRDKKKLILDSSADKYRWSMSTHTYTLAYTHTLTHACTIALFLSDI